MSESAPHNPAKSTTVASPFVAKLLEGARSKGYDVNKVLLENGISPTSLNLPGSRVTFEQLASLTLALANLLDDEFLGLTDRPVRRGTFRLNCYTAINAETLSEAMQLMASFANIAAGSLVHEVEAAADEVRYTLRRRPGSVILNGYAFEYCLLSIHRSLNWMANARTPLREVHVDFPEPGYRDEYRYMFLGAPIRFGRASASLVFEPAVLAMENVRDIRQAKAFVRQAPLTLLSQTIARDDLPARLRAWLESQLRRNRRVPGIDKAADAMGLHPQAMRRQLSRHDTSYRAIKSETRRDLAINLIGDPARTVESISDALDYSEPSAFIRAFRGWTGLTPLAYRKLSLPAPSLRPPRETRAEAAEAAETERRSDIDTWL